MSALIDDPFTRSQMKPLYNDDNDWASENSDRSWIVSASGNMLHALDPRPEEIDIFDIATALSRTARFGGRTNRCYSVAQHCVLGARQVEGDKQLTFLLHDVEEAYTGDIPRPIKRDPRFAAIRDVAEKIRTTVFEHFGLDPVLPEWVHEVDARMLATEKRDLLPRGGNARWHVRADPYRFTIDPWLPDEARAEFLLLFRQLTNTLSPRREPRRRSQEGEG